MGTSRKALMKAVEDSLRRLDTEYIDLYQMHRYDYETPLEETLSTLNDLVRQGKVRYIGVSNWSASQITEAAYITKSRNWEPPISLQPQYSILARDSEVEIVPVCQKFGLGIIPWSPLGGGMLTGKVVRKYIEGDEHLLDLEVWAENQQIGVTAPSTATVRLPLRQRRQDSGLQRKEF